MNAELTIEQISIIIRLINKTSFLGENIETVTTLKQTLLLMLKQKQSTQFQQEQPETQS